VRTRTSTLILVAGALLATSTTAWAQRGPQEGAGQATRERQMEQMQDRERIAAPDRLQTLDQDRPKLQDKDQDRDRDQDRIRDRIHQTEVFGYQLMTEQERTRHQEQLRVAASEQERDQIRAEHREEMLKRAQERGIELEEPELEEPEE
jgi:hypothetical protein